MNEITGTTRLMATIGDPIRQVLAPQEINRVMAARGIDAVLVAIQVPVDGLATVADGFRAMANLEGFIVTVPHKTAFVALCDELTPAAARVGAVNIVRRLPDGRLRGGILDGIGFVGGLRGAGIDPSGQRVYLAGAGGASTAIAYAFGDAGVAAITIANRDAAKAEALIARLAKEFPAIACAVGTRDPSGHDLVVNCTSLGMKAGDAFPLDVEHLAPDQVVAEVIMKPVDTPLLVEAAKRGCRIHHGKPMLISQIELMADFMLSDDA